MKKILLTGGVIAFCVLIVLNLKKIISALGFDTGATAPTVLPPVAPQQIVAPLATPTDSNGKAVQGSNAPTSTVPISVTSREGLGFIKTRANEIANDASQLDVIMSTINVGNGVTMKDYFNNLKQVSKKDLSVPFLLSPCVLTSKQCSEDDGFKVLVNTYLPAMSDPNNPKYQGRDLQPITDALIRTVYDTGGFYSTYATISNGYTADDEEFILRGVGSDWNNQFTNCAFGFNVGKLSTPILGREKSYGGIQQIGIDGSDIVYAAASTDVRNNAIDKILSFQGLLNTAIYSYTLRSLTQNDNVVWSDAK